MYILSSPQNRRTIINTVITETRIKSKKNYNTDSSSYRTNLEALICRWIHIELF